MYSHRYNKTVPEVASLLENLDISAIVNENKFSVVFQPYWLKNILQGQ